MDNQYLVDYLKSNLSIEISQITEFGPDEQIEIKMYLEGELIDESSCSLPAKCND